MSNKKIRPEASPSQVIGIIGALVLSACGQEGADFETLQGAGSEIISAEEISYIFSLSPAERDGTVAFLNDEATTLEQLDIDCALRSDAARWIIRSRPFADIYEAADTRQVGVWNLNQAVSCAIVNGYVDIPVIEPIEGDTVTEVFWDDLSLLSSELQAVVNAMIAEAQAQADARCQDPQAQWGCFQGTFSFIWAEVTTTGGVHTGTVFQIYRVIDPDGGIAETVNYTVDANYEVTDAYWDAG